ncbi:MAG: hypothetical protein Q7U80_08140 [Thiobacillus sp.]|nr:hypothetical protein [Thiobacillus sp.]
MQQPDPLQGIAQTSQLAISAASQAVELVKWMFVAAAVFLTMVAAVAAFIGVRSVRDLTVPLQQQLDAYKVKFSELTILDADLKTRSDQLQVEIDQLRTELATQTTDHMDRLQGVFSSGQVLMVETLDVTRKLTLALNLFKGKPEASALFREMRTPLDRIKEEASKLKYDRLLLWALSTQAYALSELGDFSEAISVEEEAIKLIHQALEKSVEGITEQRLAEKYYNLACYFSLFNQDKAAKLRLRDAIKYDPELKEDARKDDDFASLRDDPEFREIVGLD